MTTPSRAEPSSGPRIAIVVPCYNEAERLDLAAFERFLAAEPELELLFVDDGSSDRTREVLERFREGCGGRVQVLALERNSGKAEAVRRGMLQLLESNARYVGFWDADLATPLDEIPRFAQLLEEHPDAEIVFGSRVKLLGRKVERNAWRHYSGRIFATVVSTMLGLPIYDTQCGAKLFRATPDLKALFETPFLSRWVFDVEILARLIATRGDEGPRSAQRVVHEYPLAQWVDVSGSKLRASDFLKAIYELARIYAAYLR
jgi:glycosyltransferase involved in cell wall biosynthesis